VSALAEAAALLGDIFLDTVRRRQIPCVLSQLL